MPRPAKAVDRRFATQYMIMAELPKLPPHLRRRLQAIRALFNGISTADAANAAGVTQRAVQRWLAIWNNEGADALLKRIKRGPKRKIGQAEFDRDLYPLILTADGRQMTTWSVADVQRRFAEKGERPVSLTTLWRTFRRFGYRPPTPPRKTPAKETGAWNYPWPQEYGRSLADLLSKQEPALNANGDAGTEKRSDAECDVDDEAWVTG